MRMTRARTLRATMLVALLLAVLLATVGCSPETQDASDDEAVKQAYTEAFAGNDMASTFIGEKFYDKKVTNETEALEAIKSVYDRIGADDTTELEINAIRPTEDGPTYYIFNQKAGDVLVYGSSVKLVTNKDNEAVALVSAILPDVMLAKAEDWAIDAKAAEQIVVKECEEAGHPNMSVVEDSTEQTIIAVPGLEDRRQYAWVVYTANYDDSSHMGYLAHYVDSDGSYLYALPISEPHNADAESGDKANFDFDAYDKNTWKGTVTLHDGTTKEIEVPVLVNPETNEVVLADADRKILCADFAQWKFEETILPSVSEDESFNNTDLLAYDTFIKVWDFYASIGWKGPDGEGTPTILLMNLVDEKGDPYDNAFYGGRTNGFQTFAFNRLNPDGENVDVIAHEFTHCVTGTTMTTNLYLNDMGAINEGMSDVMGNLIEMLLGGKPESAWLIGADSGENSTLRSMKDPHEHQQPEYRWDTYYAPAVSKGTTMNDTGGVHTNSSMLNLVSYKLDQAGMKLEDQFDFWMNVALTMSPCTDYPQMVELLPWCMEQTGNTQYLDALKKAIEEGVYDKTDAPESLPTTEGAITLVYPVAQAADEGLVRLLFIAADQDFYVQSWPTAQSEKVFCLLPTGDYYARLDVGDAEDFTAYAYNGASWEKYDPDNTPINEVAENGIVHVEGGKTIELATDGIPSYEESQPPSEAQGDTVDATEGEATEADSSTGDATGTDTTQAEVVVERTQEAGETAS